MLRRLCSANSNSRRRISPADWLGNPTLASRTPSALLPSIPRTSYKMRASCTESVKPPRVVPPQFNDLAAQSKLFRLDNCRAFAKQEDTQALPARL